MRNFKKGYLCNASFTFWGNTLHIENWLMNLNKKDLMKISYLFSFVMKIIEDVFLS